MSDGRTKCGVAPIEETLDEQRKRIEAAGGRVIDETELHDAFDGQPPTGYGYLSVGAVVPDMHSVNEHVKPFTKWDKGKHRASLKPDWITWEEIAVLEHGAENHGDRNWQKCTEPVRYLDALRRHLRAIINGEVLDPDSGLPHTAHAQCNLTFLRWFQANKPELMAGLEDFL